MIFENYLKNGKVVKGFADIQKSRALIKMSDNSIATIQAMKINEVNASIVLTISYESLRELLEAMCLREGFKVYSHEAYTAYLKMKNETEFAAKFDRFRKLRNGVNYYGESVSKEVSEEAFQENLKLNKKIKEKYLSIKNAI